MGLHLDLLLDLGIALDLLGFVGENVALIGLYRVLQMALQLQPFFQLAHLLQIRPQAFLLGDGCSCFRL